MWNFKGQQRPPFADEPGAGQESVWDYPRPPALRADRRLVEVEHDGQLIAKSRETCRVCETASPPTFYIPPAHVDWSLLTAVDGGSYCEWKGMARYWGLAAAPASLPVGWTYPRPRPPFLKLKDFICFYPGRVECRVDDERVRPQPGRFYGGWITDDIAGPFKGAPGTGHW
jgi:uncharacterized protein (DUF427 family)